MSNPNIKIAVTYVEFDLPRCALNFAQSPCTADPEATPCFNTRNKSYDCLDPANYTEEILTIRFAENKGGEYWPFDDVQTFPILESADSRSAIINPAVDMGRRAQCTIRLSNALSSMPGIDKNLIARSDPFNTGTFLGKFKAIFPYIFGAEVRVYRGYAGQDLSLNPEYYTIDNFRGPDNAGGMTFDCVDFLKLTNGDSSQFPIPTEGTLVADIDEVATSFTVEPAGIGDLQYPASGRIAVGKEGMEFTRAGDVFTVVRGGVNGLGDVSSHDEGDSVQFIGEYVSQSSADIIYDLIVNYTPLSASYIDLAQWQEEVNSFQNTLYTAAIVKPESVKKLIDEIIEQAGLIFYADVKTRKIILKVLRPIPSTSALIDDDQIIGFSQSEMQKERVSQAWTFYNQKNPFLQLNDESNYYSKAISPTAENLYLTEVIKKTFSRWIPAFAQATAFNLNSRIIERYQHPPRRFTFNLFRDFQIKLGQGALVTHRALEGLIEPQETRPTYITELNYGKAENSITAHEFVFSEYTGEGGGGAVEIPIDSDVVSKSLRELYDSQFSSLVGVTSVKFIVRAGAFFGGLNKNSYAMTVGDFGAITPELVIDAGGYIVGSGGNGTTGGVDGDGGPALNADYPIVIENNGIIAGGGGAGGTGTAKWKPAGSGITLEVKDYAAGCAGAGYVEGAGAQTINSSFNPVGSRTLGQTVAQTIAYFEDRGYEIITATYGDGGDLGQSGSAGAGGPGYSAGIAIANNSNITWTNMGDIRGAIT